MQKKPFYEFLCFGHLCLSWECFRNYYLKLSAFCQTQWASIKLWIRNKLSVICLPLVFAWLWAICNYLPFWFYLLKAFNYFHKKLYFWYLSGFLSLRFCPQTFSLHFAILWKIAWWSLSGLHETFLSRKNIAKKVRTNFFFRLIHVLRFWRQTP